MTDFLFALIGAALISHLLLGLPMAANLRRHALGPNVALLILVAVPLAWLAERVLQALALPALYLLTCGLLSAALSWLVPMLLARWRPTLAEPPLNLLLLGNGLGAMLLARPLENFSSALLMGLAGGLGFWLVLQLLHDLHERIEQGAVPSAFRGVPIMLISTGLMGLACLGLNGLGGL